MTHPMSVAQITKSMRAGNTTLLRNELCTDSSVLKSHGRRQRKAVGIGRRYHVTPEELVR